MPHLPWQIGHIANYMQGFKHAPFAREQGRQLGVVPHPRGRPGRSRSSGSSHTISAPQSSAFTPPVAAQPPRSPSSQLTAGQRSPARRTRERSRSTSSRGARPGRESRSRSRSPRRRRYSRSPRRGRRHQETSGVAELTSKMSQFMEVMMGQQSLLMTLANVVPRAPELPTGPVAGQPVVPPPVPHGQPQEVWDVDAVSRDASDAEPLFEEGTEPEVTSQHSEQDDPEVLDTNDPMWSVVERAARHLGVDWPASEPTRRSLFELPSAHTLQSRILPAFPDFIKEVQSTWGAPASTPATSRKAAAFNMHGASEAGLASFPPVGAAFAALVKAPTLSGLAKDPSCPNRQCRITEAHLKKGYAAATEAVRLSNVASLLTVYQAALLRDLPECPSAALRTELGTVAQLLVKLAQLNARAQGRSIASLVVARRQLWLSQARVQEPDKVPLLDAPISPGHTFGPAVEEMLQRSVKAREASQQLAKMWPSKPFQPRRPQERQWRRAPPQQQAQSRGSKTTPSGVSARGQPAFARPQRGGWRPRGGGKPRPRGSGQAPRERFAQHQTLYQHLASPLCGSANASASVLAFHARYLCFGARAPALLVSVLLRLVQRFCAWCLVLCTWVQCLTHLDARRLAAPAEGSEGGDEAPHPEQELPQASLSCGHGGSGPRAAAEGEEITPPEADAGSAEPALTLVSGARKGGEEPERAEGGALEADPLPEVQRGQETGPQGPVPVTEGGALKADPLPEVQRGQETGPQGPVPVTEGAQEEPLKQLPPRASLSGGGEGSGPRAAVGGETGAFPVTDAEAGEGPERVYPLSLGEGGEGPERVDPLPSRAEDGPETVPRTSKEGPRAGTKPSGSAAYAERPSAPPKSRVQTVPARVPPPISPAVSPGGDAGGVGENKDKTQRAHPPT
ncbi:UNVERIFIED_CONTAM: hypothetical protein FKN15_037825 [Acipenser sinensis]